MLLVNEASEDDTYFILLYQVNFKSGFLTYSFYNNRVITKRDISSYSLFSNRYKICLLKESN